MTIKRWKTERHPMLNFSPLQVPWSMKLKKSVHTELDNSQTIFMLQVSVIKVKRTQYKKLSSSNILNFWSSVIGAVFNITCIHYVWIAFIYLAFLFTSWVDWPKISNCSLNWLWTINLLHKSKYGYTDNPVRLGVPINEQSWKRYQ